jgi:hypothetical protein
MLTQSAQTHLARLRAHAASDRSVPMLALLATVVVSLCVGYLASRNLVLPMIGLVVVIGVVIWAVSKPAAILLVLAGVVLVPTPAMQTAAVHGIRLQTGLGIITASGAFWLWCRQRARGANVALNPAATAALVIILVAGVCQLMFSQYAELRPLYQCSFFWLSGLLLGSVVAYDRRMLGYLAYLGLGLTLFTIFEFLLGQPNLWGRVIGGQTFELIATLGGINRATATFGHPLVAGIVLVTLAFLALSSGRRGGTVMFGLIVAGTLVTGSRSAFVGFGVGLIVLILSGQRRPSQKLAIIGTTIVIGWILIASIPALNSALNSRVVHASSTEDRVRLNSLRTLKQSFDDGDPTLITGRGVQGSQVYLKQTGGNLGFPVYDNQYATSIYDNGYLVFGAAVILIAIGVIKTRPGWQLAAPLVVISSTLLFFDGLYWPIIGVLFWFTVGLASAPATRAYAQAQRLDRARLRQTSRQATEPDSI